MLIKHDLSAFKAASFELSKLMLCFQVQVYIMKAINLYEKHQLCTRCDTKLGSKDAKFQTHDSKSKGRKEGKKPRKDIECFNCHKKGHLAATATGPAATRRDRTHIPRRMDINPRGVCQHDE